MPDDPLQPGRDYRLVLDARTEFPLRLSGTGAAPRIASVVYDGRTFQIRFDREAGDHTIELTEPDGSSVAYDVDRAIDGRELRLKLRRPQQHLLLTIDGKARQEIWPATGLQ